jgi:hypothetical protein
MATKHAYTRSPAQTAASRENGEKSQGPLDTSKSRFNAVKHGILSDVVFCRDENECEAFDALLEGLREEWDPVTQTEAFYLERIAHCMWKLRGIELRYGPDSRLGPANLVLLGRYERHVSRELAAAEEKLRDLQTERIEAEGGLADAGPAQALHLELLSDETNPSLPANEGVEGGSDVDETNPSLSVSGSDSCPPEHHMPLRHRSSSSHRPPSLTARTESLRRVARVFEIFGGATDADRSALRAAARHNLATVVPR